MLAIIWFEIHYRVRMASTYIYFLLFGALSFCFAATDLSQSSTGGPLTHINAPLVVSRIVAILMALGSVSVTGLIGTAIYRDFETKAHELFFTTRMRKRDYLLGRFLGSWIVSLGIFSSLLLGFWLGTLMPWVPHWKLGPFVAGTYVLPFFGIILPNLLLIGAVLFTLGALTRNPLGIYVSGVLFLVIYLFGISLLENLDNRTLAGMIDPFGMTALRQVTRHWSIAERNSLMIPLTGLLLWNRLLWTGIGLVVYAVGYRLFRFSAQPLGLRKKKQQDIIAPANDASVAQRAQSEVSTRPNILITYFHLSRFYLREILRGIPFWALFLCGFLVTITTTWEADQNYGTATYPVTRVMVESESTFVLFLLILVTFYTGELVWRERTAQLDQIADTQPVPTWATLLSKLTAILGMVAALNIMLMLAGVATQILKGYFHFEIGLYLSYLFGVYFPYLACLAVAAFCIHTIVNHKFLSHALVLLSLFISSFLRNMGWDHTLYHINRFPRVVYSDMNGYGPFLHPVASTTLYWLAFSVLMTLLTLRLWVRGKEIHLRNRWQSGKLTLGARIFAGMAALCWLGMGAYIFTNTNIRHEYFTKSSWRRLWAGYEKKYKAHYEPLPQPRIIEVNLDISLYPERSQFDLKGMYLLKNKTRQEIRDVVLLVDRSQTVKALRFDRKTSPAVEDKRTGFYVFRLSQPLRPDEQTRLEFDLAYDKIGFSNGRQQTHIVANGTFLSEFIPQLGYQPDRELTDYEDRRQERLPHRPRMAQAEDLKARGNTYVDNDADWIRYEATVRTAPDQIALTPGYLAREWMEGGRRCFHYKMDAPIRNFLSVVSARYQVYRDRWQSPDGKPVSIEIYYHPDHAYNLERMAKGAKKALAYCSANFSPYQFRQLRILEFPAYKSLAQSFANTIPYSEGIGFIARIREGSDDIDYPFYVTAHETAHQWWAHQVLGGNVEGSEMLAESLAEYSALMVMQQEYGSEKIQKFLRYDLDQYLSGRSSEGTGEQPLLRVQHQPYIHYNKGSLVFYALQDQIGEQTLNGALSKFVKDKSFQEPPYTNSLELFEYLKAVTPSHSQRFLSDLFEKITFYENQLVSAQRVKIGAHRWKVTLKTNTRMMYADKVGNETLAPEDVWIEVGIYGKAKRGERLGKPLILERKRFTQAKTTLTYEVAEEPEQAGIDPNSKLIDRTPEDNLLRITDRAQ